MDRPEPPGHGNRRTAASLSTDRLRGVCLERTIELDNARLVVREWPGLEGPLVHVPSGDSALIELLATRLPPRYRLWSIKPHDIPYQVAAYELLGALDQFGFTTSVLLGERLGCVPALVLAAWYPERCSGLVLFEPSYDSQGEGIAARALRDCPPDVTALRSAVVCPTLIVSGVPEIETFLATTLP